VVGFRETPDYDGKSKRSKWRKGQKSLASLVSFGPFVNLRYSGWETCRQCCSFVTDQQWNGWCRVWGLPPGLRRGWSIKLINVQDLQHRPTVKRVNEEDALPPLKQGWLYAPHTHLPREQGGLYAPHTYHGSRESSMRLIYPPWEQGGLYAPHDLPNIHHLGYNQVYTSFIYTT